MHQKQGTFCEKKQIKEERNLSLALPWETKKETKKKRKEGQRRKKMKEGKNKKRRNKEKNDWALK